MSDIVYVEEAKKEKNFRGMMKSWHDEAKKAGKAFCSTCARVDFNNGRLGQSWTNYANLEKIGGSQIVNKKDGKVLGMMEDYVCPKGHGTSVEKLIEQNQTKAKE